MTNGEIDRLGVRIGNSKEISHSDLECLQAYRQTFQEPLSNVFNFVLNVARRIDRKCIVTYRVKRIDTIIEKLRRFKDNENGRMNLARMWDIAGCRCIMRISDTTKLYTLLDAILKEFGSDCKINDHVVNPSKSGYRSIHIYVKDKQTNKPVEIQLRNKVHHNWATLVEIVDLLYGSNNKELGEKGPLGRFLYLYSRANDLTETEFNEMLNLERRNKVFEKMSKVLTRNYLNIRRQWLNQKQQGNYYVITANKRQSEIISFPTFKEAENAYYDKYLNNRDSNIVLTHLRQPDFEEISMAYSNYVLAMHAFFDDYRSLLAERIIESVKNERYRSFFRYFNIYNNDVRCHFENMTIEVKAIAALRDDKSISWSHGNKWFKEIRQRLQQWAVETQDFMIQLRFVSKGSWIKQRLIKNRINQLASAVADGLHPES